MSKGAWLDSNPPKDGMPIVVIGRIIWRDEFSTSVDSFVALIRWEKDQSGYEGWHFDRDGMTVARTLDDEVMVDWWLPLPSAPTEVILPGAAPLKESNETAANGFVVGPSAPGILETTEVPA